MHTSKTKANTTKQIKGTYYPQSGFIRETGGDNAKGKNINVPLPCAGLGDVEYLRIWKELLIPIANDFNPQLIICAAGFDACIGDPLG